MKRDLHPTHNLWAVMGAVPLEQILNTAAQFLLTVSYLTKINGRITAFLFQISLHQTVTKRVVLLSALMIRKVISQHVVM